MHICSAGAIMLSDFLLYWPLVYDLSVGKMCSCNSSDGGISADVDYKDAVNSNKISQSASHDGSVEILTRTSLMPHQATDPLSTDHQVQSVTDRHAVSLESNNVNDDEPINVDPLNGKCFLSVKTFCAYFILYWSL